MKTIAGLLMLYSLLPQLPLQASNWEIGTIDAGGIGRYSSLRIDNDGNAHVIYVVDEAGNQLRYGFWDHLLKKWFTMTVDGGATFASLTLDSKQRPHISYAEYGTCEGCRLKYAHWDGRQWIREIIPLNSEVIAFYTSIALDAEDRPTIGFYEYRGPKASDFVLRMREVTWTGTRWEVQTIDGLTSSGKFSAMAYDSQHGLMRLAFANVNDMTAGVRMATRHGKEWRMEIVEGKLENQGHTVGYSLAMTLDKAGNPHLSYWDMNAPLIKYATLSNGHWVTEVVDTHPGEPAYWDRNSIAVDDEGHPYMTYYDGRHGQLHLAHKEGGRWSVETVDEGLCGFTSSLQIDHGTIWITYADDENHQLKVARRPLTTPSPQTTKDKGPARAEQSERGKQN